jgi:predicted metal-binding membrane protein
MSASGLEAVLRRDRLVTALSLVVVVVLAWAYVGWFATSMSMSPSPSTASQSGAGMDMSMDMDLDTGAEPAIDQSPMDMVLDPELAPWSASDFAFMASMWIAMMIGMMTPSAAPMILLYSRVGRSSAAQGKPFASTAWFAGGYILAWTAFAMLATGAQWLLEQLALLNPMMSTSSRVLGGSILIVAGLYQWTPMKAACLGQCRAPLAFIQEHGGFRRDAPGSVKLGLQHGIYCIGCCWALMGLLFVGGVMNPLWIAGIILLVLLEKLVPAANWLTRLAGVALVAGGVWMLVVA